MNMTFDQLHEREKWVVFLAKNKRSIRDFKVRDIGKIAAACDYYYLQPDVLGSSLFNNRQKSE